MRFLADSLSMAGQWMALHCDKNLIALLVFNQKTGPICTTTACMKSIFCLYVKDALPRNT